MHLAVIVGTPIAKSGMSPSNRMPDSLHFSSSDVPTKRDFLREYAHCNVNSPNMTVSVVDRSGKGAA